MEQALKSGVDGIHRQARADGDPTGIGPKGRRTGEAQDGLGILPRTRLGYVGSAEMEVPAELADCARREHAPTAENLRERRVIGAQVARKRPQRVAAISLPALVELGRELVT